MSRRTDVTFDVRDAGADDARAIAEVHVASWRWAYEGILPAATLDALSVDDRERMWGQSLTSPQPGQGCVVAERDGSIIGFAGFGPPEDAGQPVGTGELHAIYLTRDVQGTGIGRALLEAATDRLREAGFRRAILWVLEANDLGRRFYERAGWTWDGATSTHRFDCGNQPIVRYGMDL